MNRRAVMCLRSAAGPAAEVRKFADCQIDFERAPGGFPAIESPFQVRVERIAADEIQKGRTRMRIRCHGARRDLGAVGQRDARRAIASHDDPVHHAILEKLRAVRRPLPQGRWR